MKSKFISIVVAAIAAVPVFAHEGQGDATATTAPTTCIVSGDKLGEMGPPVHYTYKQAGKPDRQIEFCCKDCIADFEKDPAKYLAKLDARAAGKTATATSQAAPTAKAEACCELIDRYVPVSEALAADDLVKAKSASADLAKQADADGMATVAKAAHAIGDAKDISAARESFKGLSAELEPMADGVSYVVMTCPMAQADWIQTDKNVRNPYYGKSMLTCGGPKAPSAQSSK
jgi:hypothetical protein